MATSVSGAYADYAPEAPEFYMERTARWVEQGKRGCPPAANAATRKVEL